MWMGYGIIIDSFAKTEGQEVGMADKQVETGQNEVRIFSCSPLGHRYMAGLFWRKCLD